MRAVGCKFVGVDEMEEGRYSAAIAHMYQQQPPSRRDRG